MDRSGVHLGPGDAARMTRYAYPLDAVPMIHGRQGTILAALMVRGNVGALAALMESLVLRAKLAALALASAAPFAAGRKIAALQPQMDQVNQGNTPRNAAQLLEVAAIHAAMLRRCARAA